MPKKGAKAVGKAPKARFLVTGAASKLKKAVTQRRSGLTLDSNQSRIEGMYSEAKLMEVDVELSGGQVKKVSKPFCTTRLRKNKCPIDLRKVHTVMHCRRSFQ